MRSPGSRDARFPAATCRVTIDVDSMRIGGSPSGSVMTLYPVHFDDVGTSQCCVQASRVERIVHVKLAAICLFGNTLAQLQGMCFYVFVDILFRRVYRLPHYLFPGFRVRSPAYRWRCYRRLGWRRRRHRLPGCRKDGRVLWRSGRLPFAFLAALDVLPRFSTRMQLSEIHRIPGSIQLALQAPANLVP